MRRYIGAGVLAAALVAGAGLAQDGPVTIKVKKPGPGDVIRETKAEKSTNKVTVTVMGMNQVMDEGGEAKFVYTEKVIDKPAGAKKATKLERTYETAELTVKGEAAPLDLAGKTVLIEKKGDRYEFTAGGKAVSGKAGELLGKEFGRKSDVGEEAFLPKTPVKVGDSWKPDLAELGKELSEEGMTVDVPKSSATAKLTKVYKKGGATFGVIAVTVELAVTKVVGGGNEIPLKDGSKLTMAFELDGCIDGTLTTGSSKLTMTGALSGEIMGVGLNIALKSENKGTAEEVKK